MGGVINPIARDTTTKTPKWIGSKPSELAIGTNSGVRIIMFGDVSIRHPATNNIKKITNTITIGLEDMPIIAPTSTAGILSYAIISAITRANATTGATMPFTFALFSIMSGSFFNFMPPFEKSPAIRQYAQATAPASVGVNIPP